MIFTKSASFGKFSAKTLLVFFVSSLFEEICGFAAADFESEGYSWTSHKKNFQKMKKVDSKVFVFLQKKLQPNYNRKIQYLRFMRNLPVAKC